MSLNDLTRSVIRGKADNNGEDGTVDIVAVHGFNEDSIDSWKDPASGIMWLQDLLPESITAARVLTFGYDNLVPSKSNISCADSIHQHAYTLVARLQADRSLEDRQRRPVIFVCHGLGGIIVKQALLYSSSCLSKNVEHLHSICASTFAILFFGTPHTGTDKARWHTVSQSWKSRIFPGDFREAKLSSSAERDSEAVQLISEHFTPLMKQFHIYFFWEQHPTRFSDAIDFVVDRYSAAPNIDNAERSAVSANHADMVRFSNRESSGYRTVEDALIRYCREAPKVIAYRWVCLESRLAEIRAQEATEYLGLGFDVHKSSELFKFHNQATARHRNKHFYIPQVVSSIFTGREDKSAFVRDALFEGRGTETTWQQRRIVIYGTAGAGKTQFCCKFAQDHRERLWGVFWIDASSRETAKSSFSQIGKLGQLATTESAGKHWLSNLEESWLLIVNNADDPSLELQNLFPEGDRGLVLVTTRNPNFAIHATVGSLEFEGMEEREALILFLKSAGIRQPWDRETEELGAQITNTLGRLALALIQAGAFILQKICELKDYLTFHNEHKRRLSSSITRGQTDGREQNSIFSTWELSRTSLASRKTEASDDALDLLNVVGFFHFENIRVDIFDKALQNRTASMKKPDNITLSSKIATSFEDRVRPPAQLPRFLRQDVDDIDSYRARAALRELISFRFVYYDGKNGSFSLHSLVHEWIRDRMSKGHREFWAQLALNVLSESILLPPNDIGPLHEEFRKDILAHLDNCISLAPISNFHFIERFGSSYWSLKRLLRLPILFQFREDVMRAAKFGYVFADRGRFADAADLLNKVKNALVESRGYENDNTWRSMMALAGVYWGLGRLEEAVELQNRVVEARSKVLGPRHRDTLLAMNQLGKSHWLKGEYHEALELQLTTTDRMKSVLGPTDDDTLAAMDNLGVIFGSWQRYQESAEVHRQVLESRTGKLGPDHLDTLETMNNLAMALLDLKEPLKSKELMEIVCTQRRQKLGKEHPWTLWALCNLAKIDTELGLFGEAEEILIPGIAAAKRSLGEGHLGVLMGSGQLALVYGRQRRYDEAEILTSETVARLENHRGKEHPDTVYAIFKQAQLYHYQNKIEMAIELCELALERADMRLSRSHPLGRDIIGYLEGLRAPRPNNF